MMLPVTTGCPPKIFTPRRLLCESRPFFTLPSPFLCAMIMFLKFQEPNSKNQIGSSAFLLNIGYFDLSISRTMTFLFMQHFSSFLFIGDHSVTLYMIHDLSLYFCLYCIADR